jgi:hypothetical protein
MIPYRCKLHEKGIFLVINIDEKHLLEMSKYVDDICS